MRSLKCSKLTQNTVLIIFSAFRSLTSHASLSEETRLALKITDNLIRLSIGIEDVEDLVEDLKNGLDNM